MEIASTFDTPAKLSRMRWVMITMAFLATLLNYIHRLSFTYLSADVIAMFKHATLTSGAIYVQHCPMANKGDGGDWLRPARCEGSARALGQNLA